MVVVELSVPTGFAPVIETQTALMDADSTIRRYEVGSRMVVLYIGELPTHQLFRMDFGARALYQVKASAVTSRVCSYYSPDWRAETLSESINVDGTQADR